MSRTTRIWVATATAGGALGGTTWLMAREAHRQWGLVAAPGPTRLDEAVTLLATVLALVGCLWLATSTVVALLAHVPGLLGDRARGLAHVLAPAFTQRVAAVLVGAAVGGTLAPATALGLGSAPVDGTVGYPATAVTWVTSLSTGARPGPGLATTTSVTAAATTTSVTAASETAGVATAVALPSEARPGAGPGFAPTTATSPPTGGGATGPGWTPSRPVVRPQASPDLLTTSPFASEGGTVVVHRGDTLWDLVRSHLGHGASDAEVAQAWPRWYAANRGTIGPDPGLLLPGQVLRAPVPESTWEP